MPMIATTIISSIRVKPFCSLFIGNPLLTGGKSIGLYPTCLDARNDHARFLCFYKRLIFKKDHIHQRQIIHTAERFLQAPFGPQVSNSVTSWAAVPASRGSRRERHLGDEFVCGDLHERRRVSGLFQSPLDAVAEAGLLVQVRPMLGGEPADA